MCNRIKIVDPLRFWHLNRAGCTLALGVRCGAEDSEEGSVASMSDDGGDNDSLIDEPSDNEADGPADDIADAENATESESSDYDFDYSDSAWEEESESEPNALDPNGFAEDEDGNVEAADESAASDSDPADEEDNVLVGNNVQQNNPAAPAPVQGHQVAETQMQEVYVEGRPPASGGHELARAYYAYVMQLLEAGFSYSRSIVSHHGGRADIYVRPMPRREE